MKIEFSSRVINTITLLFFFHPMTNQEIPKRNSRKNLEFLHFRHGSSSLFRFHFRLRFLPFNRTAPTLNFFANWNKKREKKIKKKDTWKRRKPWMMPSSYIKSTDCVRMWGDKLYRGWPPNRRHQKKRTFWKTSW